MTNNSIVTPKRIYILLLFIIPLSIFVIKPTYSKFTQTITTEKEIVNINTSLSMNISNIYEYKTLTISSNDYDVFDIEITNNTENSFFYGFWYKIVTSNASNDNITISKLNTSENSTQDQLEVSETKKVTLIIKNRSNNPVKLNIGVSTSNDSIEDIKYEEKTEPIIKEDYETTIYYDIVTNKYYFSQTNTEVEFKNEPTTYKYNMNYQTFTAPYSGYYQIGLWAPSTTTQSGDHLSTSVYLPKSTSIYFYVGRNRANNIFAETDVRLEPGSWEKTSSLNSRILIAGNDINTSYIYGYENPKDQETNNDYHLNDNTFYNLKIPKDSIITSNTNQGDGLATVEYLSNQEPTIEGIKYVKLGQNYKLEDITCKDNGRGCQLIKVRPETTENLEIGTYEIIYIVTDSDNISYKFTETFEVISE